MTVDQKNGLVMKIERHRSKRGVEDGPSSALVQATVSDNALISTIYVYLIVRIAHPVRSMLSLYLFRSCFH